MAAFLHHSRQHRAQDQISKSLTPNLGTPVSPALNSSLQPSLLISATSITEPSFTVNLKVMPSPIAQLANSWQHASSLPSLIHQFISNQSQRHKKSSIQTAAQISKE
jgi:hypothetical protein